jgi:2-hydroxy-6-oxonona-2,4-dienedioate hydrolase
VNTIWSALQGVPFRQAYLDVRGVRTRVIEAGDGPPLVLLHGTGGHAEAYARNVEAHAEHFHVYAIDMVGHGYSAMPDIDYGPQSYVDFLRDLADAIGEEKLFVSGESLGAQVAAWFAIQHPKRVHKIVMNTGMLLPPDDLGRQDFLEFIELTKKATGAPTRDAIRERLRWLVHEDHSVTDELIEVRFQIYTQPGRAENIGKIGKASLATLLDEKVVAQWTHAGLLKQISCPTLVLWTRHNPGQRLPLAEEGAKLIPHAELVVFENSAHWPQWEEPEAFNRDHLHFLLK